MNRGKESEVILFVNDEKEEFSFYNKEIEEHIKDLELIFESYFEHSQRERPNLNNEDNEDRSL